MTLVQHISRCFLWLYAGWAVWRGCEVEVRGLEHLPRSGPVLLAARHYHHLHDATVLLSVVPRSLHFLVAFDWAGTRRARWLLERACGLTVWPGLLREDMLQAARGAASPVWQPSDIEPYRRRSIQESVAILVAGRALAVFPEGSPIIDPQQPPRASDSVLPFKQGFVTIARQTARALGRPVPVVPVGFAYQQMGTRWRVRVCFGAPMLVDQNAERGGTARAVEVVVRRLSGV